MSQGTTRPTGSAKPRLRRVTPKRGKRPKIYMVNVDLETGPEVYMERTGSKHRMYSYHQLASSPQQMQQAMRARELGLHVFLDSGAFFFQGRWKKPVRGKVGRYDLLLNFDQEREAFQDAYIAFCLEHGWRFDAYANFDWCENSKNCDGYTA